MQLDLIESKVWIEHNSTEIFIDRELIGRGVAPQDIVLGFRSRSVFVGESPKVRERLALALHTDVASKP